MKSYDLLIEQDSIPTQQNKLLNGTVIFAVLCFVAVICIGILYFGKANFEAIFYIVLSCYATLLGFMVAFHAIKRRDKLDDKTFYRQMISESSQAATLVYHSESDTIVYKDKSIPTILGTTLTSLSEINSIAELHPLDRSQLVTLLKFDQADSFSFIMRKQTRSGTTYWIMVEASKMLKKEGSYIILKFRDVTASKQEEVTQQQYLAEMENIIRQNQYQDNRMQHLAQLITVHDMKEPLRTIKSYIQLIERRYKDSLDETGLECMHYVSDASYRMTHMIDDMLANSGMDEENTELKEVNMNALVAEVIQDLGARIKETGAGIHYRSLPRITADARQLKHLIQNLIENALKYRSSQTPEIFIDCEHVDNKWVFKVEDNGIGIAPKHQDSIFSFFERGQIRNGYKGMGIGLAICKKIVNNHDGDIWVHSAGESKGSIFYFSFPTQNAAILKTKAETATHAAVLQAAY